MVSKMLNAEDRITPRGSKKISIGHILGVVQSSPIHNRTFRNHLEHYDDRLKKWIKRYATGAKIGTYNIGPKSAFSSPDMILVSHYDPSNDTFTFVDEDFNLSQLSDEVKRIRQIAEKWVTDMQSGIIQLPFC
jgi:hypothetical protein